VNPVTTKWNG